MSETTFDRLRRLNKASQSRVLFDPGDKWLCACASAIDDTFKAKSQSMTDYEIGFLAGFSAKQSMSGKRRKK